MFTSFRALGSRITRTIGSFPLGSSNSSEDSTGDDSELKLLEESGFSESESLENPLDAEPNKSPSKFRLALCITTNVISTISIVRVTQEPDAFLRTKSLRFLQQIYILKRRSTQLSIRIRRLPLLHHRTYIVGYIPASLQWVCRKTNLHLPQLPSCYPYQCPSGAPKSLASIFVGHIPPTSETTPHTSYRLVQFLTLPGNYSEGVIYSLDNIMRRCRNCFLF